MNEPAAPQGDSAEDERERIANERDRVADERDDIADQREATSDARDLLLDEKEKRLAALEQVLDDRARSLRESVPDVVRRQQEAIDRSREVLQRAEQRLERAEASLQRSRASIQRDDAEIQREVATSSEGEPVDANPTPGKPDRYGASTGAGPRAERVAPALAIITRAMAIRSPHDSRWPKKKKPAAAPIAGSRLIRMPKTCVDSRRSAANSSEKGTADDRVATTRPSARLRGSSNREPAPAMPKGRSASPPTASAKARPPEPGTSCPTRWPITM